MLKLVISDDEGKTTVVPLVRDEITIGRKEGNTIRLTERNVSRRHARLFKNGNGAFTIEDLGSYNGIKVNGRKIAEPSSLKAGDQVTIGDYLLALQVDAAETAAEPTAPMAPPGTAEAQTAMIAAPAEPVPPARLVMLSPPAPGAEFALSKERTRFGRAEDLDAWVNHRSISREHAEIVRDADGFRIRDLGSANGLRVNGEEARDQPLQAGDVIEMGQVRFRFVGQGEAYVFDADRTIQMEAVPESSGSRAPIFAALGIIVVAIAIGGVIAMSGGDDEEPVATPIEDPMPGSATPPGAGEPAAEAVAAGGDDQAFQEALRNCQTALEEERYAEAVSHGNAAVSLRPDDQAARSCQEDAQQAQVERETFDRGKDALDRGEIDEAYLAFEELPEDSPFRDAAEVRRANQQFAVEHVRLAREEIRRNPQEAERHASMVLTMSSPPAQQQEAALALRRAARRRGAGGSQTNTSGVRRATSPSEPRERVPRETHETSSGGGTTTSGGGGGDPIAHCRQVMASGGSYTQCIIQSLEGRARSARELEALIESYRASGNQPAAFRHMQNYIRRFPSTSKARNYRQILAAHGMGQ